MNRFNKERLVSDEIATTMHGHLQQYLNFNPSFNSDSHGDDYSYGYGPWFLCTFIHRDSRDLNIELLCPFQYLPYVRVIKRQDCVKLS